MNFKDKEVQDGYDMVLNYQRLVRAESLSLDQDDAETNDCPACPRRICTCAKDRAGEIEADYDR
jgi:hypothetical protein